MQSFRCWLAGLALFGPLAFAQSVAKPSPNLAGIAHVALRVHSLDAAVAYYEKLGFVKAFELSRDGQVYEAFIKINDRQFIELYPADAKNPQIGFLHLCFEGADLEAAHAFYVEHGLTPNAVRTAGAGNLLFTMPGPLTPSGPQNMEYTQYMPGSLHSKDFGQHLTPASGPGRIAKHLVAVTIAVDDADAARVFYLDKVGFLPNGSVSKDSLAIPGTHGESVELVPQAALGFKARFAFETDLAAARTSLKQRGISFSRRKADLLLTDPDGNQVVLLSPAPSLER